MMTRRKLKLLTSKDDVKNKLTNKEEEENVKKKKKQKMSIKEEDHKTRVKLMIGSEDFDQLPDPIAVDQSGVSAEINFHNFHVYGSCNGVLLLCRGCVSAYADKPGPEELWLLNPTIGESKKLPNPPCKFIQAEDDNIRYGLGYGEASKDYKIIRIRSNFVLNREYPTPAEVTVYSLNNNKWRKVKGTYIEMSIDGPMGAMAEAGVPVNGALHWVAVDVPDYNYQNSDDEAVDKYSIVAFDIDGENFECVPTPCCDDTDGIKVAALDGNLCLISHSKSDCQVWVMKEYGSPKSWTKLFSIAEKKLLYRYDLRPLCFTKNQEHVVLFDGNLHLYNMKKKSLKTIYKLQGLYKDVCGNRAMAYTEGVFPLGANKGGVGPLGAQEKCDSS